MLALLLNGCTNSKYVISPLYNRLDDRMLSHFNDLADFTAEQKNEYRQMTGTFHVWHRRSELPRYAGLIRELASSVKSEATTSSDIQQWMADAETFSTSARLCHPVNFSFDLIKSLSDEQINAIEASFKEEQTENRERYDSRTPEERIERRLDNMSKWAKRINIRLSSGQRAMLRSAFTRQISLRKEYYALSGEWNNKLFALVRDSANPQFDELLTNHLEQFWTLMESNHNEQWQENRNLWRDTVLLLVQSMSDEQRATASQWLNKMASTLDSISKYQPSFEVADDASIGCLAEPESTASGA